MGDVSVFLVGDNAASRNPCWRLSWRRGRVTIWEAAIVQCGKSGLDDFSTETKDHEMMSLRGIFH
jgi:hypothetical protein